MSKTIALWIGMLLATSVAQAEPSALEAAYQKEFAFLTAEKKALQARLIELQGSRDQAISEAEGELSVLESRFIAVGLEGDRLDEKLDTLDREADGAAAARAWGLRSPPSWRRPVRAVRCPYRNTH